MRVILRKIKRETERNRETVGGILRKIKRETERKRKTERKKEKI